MANVSSLNNFAPGLNQPFSNIFQAPVVSVRPPGTSDKAPLGTVWIDKTSSDAYICVQVANNATLWISIAGGAGIFSSLSVTGNIQSTAGSIQAQNTITAVTGDIIASAGDIVSTLGVVRAQLDVVAFTGQVIWGGDTGVVGAGKMALTNVTNTTQGAGALTMLSTNGNSGTNTGFIKMYMGGTTVYIPYFANIAP